jgi:LmbE family N-acetylglucosaminyl deacetylase
VRPYLRAARRRLRDRRFASPVRHDPAAPALLLSPHLDDAVIDCFSVLTGSEPVQVVNVFAGIPEHGAIPSWDRICGATNIAEHARERVAEDREALATFGLEPVDLPFLGENYRAGAPRPALQDVADELAGEVPAASRVLAPAMVGEPIADHVFVRTLALALGIPVTLYADVPYAVQFGWPHWVTGAERNPRVDVDVFWERFLAQIPGLGQPRVVALSSDQAARKLETMRLYRTQFPGLDALGTLSNPRVHGFEVYWDLRSPA